MSGLGVVLPPTELQLRLTEQLLVERIVSVEVTFPNKALGAVQVQNILRNLLYY